MGCACVVWLGTTVSSRDDSGSYRFIQLSWCSDAVIIGHCPGNVRPGTVVVAVVVVVRVVPVTVRPGTGQEACLVNTRPYGLHLHAWLLK